MGMGVRSSVGWEWDGKLGMGIKCMGMGVKTWELEERRTNLSPATVNSLLFLHSNMELTPLRAVMPVVLQPETEQVVLN